MFVLELFVVMALSSVAEFSFVCFLELQPEIINAEIKIKKITGIVFMCENLFIGRLYHNLLQNFTNQNGALNVNLW